MSKQLNSTFKVKIESRKKKWNRIPKIDCSISFARKTEQKRKYRKRTKFCTVCTCVFDNSFKCNPENQPFQREFNIFTSKYDYFRLYLTFNK